MQIQFRAWEEVNDERALFLRCYTMMTSNMLVAVECRAFRDCVWVDQLLHRFADYYFIALDDYERDPRSAPVVWQVAHRAAAETGISALQKLLLGVSAHINYDLVLTLVDLLDPEWSTLDARMRSTRYEDHCQVNDVIGRSIDAVQDEVVGPAMPFMTYLDMALGPIDELLISHLIARWREGVWRNAIQLLTAADVQSRSAILQMVETDAVQVARSICRAASPD